MCSSTKSGGKGWGVIIFVNGVTGVFFVIDGCGDELLYLFIMGHCLRLTIYCVFVVFVLFIILVLNTTRPVIWFGR